MEASSIHALAPLTRAAKAGPLLRLRSDDQLVALFRMGYDEAFGAIHDRYRRRLLAYTRQMLGGSRGDAEDALQDVFLRAYGALRQDDRPVTLRAWLYRVAHNRCVDLLRRPTPPPAEIYELSRPPQQDTLATAERREELRRLVEDVQRLPEQQRSALLMRELEGLSYAELADALGVSVGAVKSLLVRARLGLVEATEARDAACLEIRADLAGAFGRGVRASARAGRHLHGCAGCREYKRALRSTRDGLAALAPGPGPWAAVAKLLGLGGAGSGASAAATAGAGGSAAVVGGGATAVTATKVVAAVCCAAVVGGGAAEVRRQVAETQAPPSPPPAKVVAHAAQAPTVVASAPAPTRAEAPKPASAPDPATARPDPSTTDPAPPAVAPDAIPTDPGTPVAVDPATVTGGALAPDEDDAPTPSSPGTIAQEATTTPALPAPAATPTPSATTSAASPSASASDPAATTSVTEAPAG